MFENLLWLCAGDVEHTHKIRSEIDKVPEDEDNIKQRYFVVEASKIKI